MQPWMLYSLIAIVVVAILASTFSKDSIRSLYTILVFLILVVSACVLGFESPSKEKMFTSAGVLVCAMFILHKRIN